MAETSACTRLSNDLTLALIPTIPQALPRQSLDDRQRIFETMRHFSVKKFLPEPGFRQIGDRFNPVNNDAGEICICDAPHAWPRGCDHDAVLQSALTDCGDHQIGARPIRGVILYLRQQSAHLPKITDCKHHPVREILPYSLSLQRHVRRFRHAAMAPAAIIVAFLPRMRVKMETLHIINIKALTQMSRRDAISIDGLMGEAQFLPQKGEKVIMLDRCIMVACVRDDPAKMGSVRILTFDERDPVLKPSGALRDNAAKADFIIQRRTIMQAEPVQKIAAGG